MQAVETFCAAAGWLLFALGALHCVLPRSFRLGVVLILLGDCFLAVGIAFPKKVLAVLGSAGIDSAALNYDLTAGGVICALALTALLYFIFIKLFRLRPWWKKAALSQGSEQAQAQGFSKGAATAAKRIAVDGKDSGGPGRADPGLFAHVRLNKQEKLQD